LRKVPEVEEARALMTEAMAWSVFTWVLRKCEVRVTADRANAALNRLKRATRSSWSSEIRLAYKEKKSKAGSYGWAASSLKAIDPEGRILIRKVHDGEQVARTARKDAEHTFDEAEKRLSTDLAREGCRKALRQWELDLKVIRHSKDISVCARLAG
jgi:hypothetical protein